jgi:vacuolar-type H+-ATPase subunit I/STV1
MREIQSVKKALSQDIEEVDDKVDDLEGTYKKGHEQLEEQIAVLKRRLERQEQNTSKMDTMKMEIVTEMGKLYVSKRQF